MSPCSNALTPQFLLRFQSLFHAGRALAFPCDARGLVPLDELSERQRENYLFARAVIGHEYANPVVMACDLRSQGVAVLSEPTKVGLVVA